MSRPAFLLAVVPLALLVTRGAVAQSSAGDAALRAKAYGEVRNLDGKAWVGAKVLLLSHLGGGGVASGCVDRCEAVTDARGRFRVPVLRGRSYSVWVTSVGEDGRTRTTPVQEAVVAGAPVLMREAKQRSGAYAFRGQGLEAWKKRGPFSLHAETLAKNPLVLTVALDAEGRASLPPLPGLKFKVELRDRRGQPITSSVEYPTLPRDRERTLTAGKPQATFVAARDVDTGNGVAGAEVLMTLGNRFVVVGKTGQDGVAEVLLPVGVSIGYNRMFVRAKGFVTAGTSTGDCRQVKAKKWKPLREGVTIKQHANLGGGLAFKGRVLLGKDTPARNLALVLRGRAMQFYERNSRSVADYVDVVHTDAEGRFVLRGCLKEDSYRSQLDLLLDGQHVAQLPKEWQRTLHPRIMDIADLADGAIGKVNDLGDIDLREFLPLELLLQDDKGVPIAGAAVSAAAVGRNDFGRAAKGGARTSDRTGRVRLLLRPGRTVGLVVDHKRGFRALVLEPEGAVAGGTVRIPLRLRAMLEVSGKVTTAKDKPIGGMSLRLSNDYSNRALPAAVGPDAELELPEAPGLVIREPTPRQMQSLLRERTGRQSVITDAAGRFKFAVPPFSVGYRIRGHRTQLGVFRFRVDERVNIEEGSVTDLDLKNK